MIARRLIFSALICLVWGVASWGAELPDSVSHDSVTIAVLTDNGNYKLDSLTEEEVNHRYLERVRRAHERWAKLIPNKFQMQYAGNVGLISSGLGWDYGKQNQWETYLLVGFIPKCHTIDEVWTFTLKEVYTPWRIAISDNIRLEPLHATLFLNTIFNGEFWTSEPERYPKGYYGFSSKLRIHIGVGQGVSLRVPPQYQKHINALTLFYEVSSCELYIRQKILSHSIPLKDIICLGVGVRLQFF